MSFERRKVRTGRVVSDKMDRTVVVAVEWRRAHPIYKKAVRRKTRFKAHDADNQCKLGDLVRIVETRPLSRTKRWRVDEILARQEIAEIQPEEIAVSEEDEQLAEPLVETATVVAEVATTAESHGATDEEQAQDGTDTESGALSAVEEPAVAERDPEEAVTAAEEEGSLPDIEVEDTKEQEVTAQLEEDESALVAGEEEGTDEAPPAASIEEHTEDERQTPRPTGEFGAVEDVPTDEASESAEAAEGEPSSSPVEQEDDQERKTGEQ